MMSLTVLQLSLPYIVAPRLPPRYPLRPPHDRPRIPLPHPPQPLFSNSRLDASKTTSQPPRALSAAHWSASAASPAAVADSAASWSCSSLADAAAPAGQSSYPCAGSNCCRERCPNCFLPGAPLHHAVLRDLGGLHFGHFESTPERQDYLPRQFLQIYCQP